MGKNFSLGFIKDYFRRHVDMLFWLVLAMFFCMVIFAVKQSVQLVMTANSSVEPIRQNKDVRIDFPAYEAAVKAVELGRVYQATSTVSGNPFKPVGKITQ